MENKETQEKGKTSATETNKPQSASGTTTGQTGNQPGGQGQMRSGQSTGSAAQPSRYQETGQRGGREQEEGWTDIKERGAEMADKAKQAVTDAYQRTSQTLNESYEQAVGYGREHPGQTALICFGVGVGVGLWLASSVNSRSRASRIVPPVMNALSDIAVQLFR